MAGDNKITICFFRLEGIDLTILSVGPTGCTATSVGNYHSTLPKLPEQRRYQVLLIWRHISFHRNLDLQRVESRTNNSGPEVRSPVKVRVY